MHSSTNRFSQSLFEIITLIEMISNNKINADGCVVELTLVNNIPELKFYSELNLVFPKGE